jgi:hypothetical protein
MVLVGNATNTQGKSRYSRPQPYSRLVHGNGGRSRLVVSGQFLFPAALHFSFFLCAELVLAEIFEHDALSAEYLSS